MRYLLTIVLAAVIASGCQEFLTIKVEKQGTLEPEFYFQSKFGTRNEIVNIRTLSITIEEVGGQNGVVWSIESQAARISPVIKPDPAPLTTLKYGSAPDGFITVVPAKRLEWGKTYQVTSALRVAGKESVVGAAGKFTPQM